MKKLKKIVGVLIVIIFLLVSVVITNIDYLRNKKQGNSDYDNYDLDSLEYVNVEKKRDNYFFNEDGYILIDLKNINAKTLEITGNVKENMNLKLKIYYKYIDQLEFTEEQALNTETIANKKGYEINLNLKTVSSIMLKPENAGTNITITSLKIKSFYPQIGWLSFLVTLIISVIFGILIQIPLAKYKAIPIYLKNFYNYRFLLVNLVKKDITLKYRRSILGILWSVLNPLLMMLVTTAVFQNLFKSDIENFPIYYLTGSLIFNFTVEATNSCMNSMLEAAPLIKKVYIPKYIFPMEKTIFSLINMIFSLIAVIIIYVTLQVTPPVTALLFPVPIIYVFFFALGFGMILATLNVFFRDVTHLYGVFTTAWMYLTPIMYPTHILPSFVKDIVRFNPLYYYVNYFRDIMYLGVVPSFRENLICIFFSASFLLVGILIFKKNQDKFVLYI